MSVTKIKLIEFMLLMFMLVINLVIPLRNHCLIQSLLDVVPSWELLSHAYLEGVY